MAYNFTTIEKKWQQYWLANRTFRALDPAEAGVMPKEEDFAAMGKFNEELVKAGILLAAEGLHPSSKGARVKFSGSERTVTDGPFTETKELIAGFWLIQVQ